MTTQKAKRDFERQMVKFYFAGGVFGLWTLVLIAAVFLILRMNIPTIVAVIVGSAVASVTLLFGLFCIFELQDLKRLSRIATGHTKFLDDGVSTVHKSSMEK